MEGPDTVAAVFMEPVQNTGGAFVPPEGYWARVREICDHYGVLLVSDEVISAFGRFGHMFGSLRYGYQPDMITFAKGVTSGYAPLGGVMISDRIAEPFVDAPTAFLQGQTFGAHPVSCAVANANLDVFEREDICGNVLANQARFKSLIDGLRDIPHRRRRARRRVLPGDRTRDRPGDPRHVHRRRRPSGCCAATCRRGCSTPG